MFVGIIAKTPSERGHMGIDYSRWLGTGTLVSLKASIGRDVTDVPDPTPARLWAVFISPEGKAVHVLVDGGRIDGDYTITLLATSSAQLIREDEVLVRLEAPI